MAHRETKSNRDSYTKISTSLFLKMLKNNKITGYSYVKHSLLSILSERPGRIIAHQELIDRIYDETDGPDDPLNVLRVVVTGLRRKGINIISHSRRGYSISI
ncbi:MAG: winged helix-turn-helix domain-containing protein [Patescibacteria group bacterium]|nr:winged helix-turn-helix domain-containing protein [Patescibacteria group bacterium]